MGIALPGGIAAKKDNPDRQVWNIMGDGAFNMCYPDVITNVQYDLPVINLVFSNAEYGFIKNKYEDTNKHLFGVDFTNADYAKIAEAQGAVGFTVDRIEDIDAVVAEAVKLNQEGKPVVQNQQPLLPRHGLEPGSHFGRAFEHSHGRHAVEKGEALFYFHYSPGA